MYTYLQFQIKKIHLLLQLRLNIIILQDFGVSYELVCAFVTLLDTINFFLVIFLNCENKLQ